MWKEGIWLVSLFLKVFFIQIRRKKRERLSDHPWFTESEVLQKTTTKKNNKKKKTRHIRLMCLLTPNLTNFSSKFSTAVCFCAWSSCLIQARQTQSQHTCCSAAVCALQSSLIEAQFALFRGIPQGQNLCRQNARAIFTGKPDVSFHRLAGWQGFTKGEWERSVPFP